ncbi:MAG: response regulator [Clostridiales bacterium]|nr:response regulator [Clostridiales bacterium]
MDASGKNSVLIADDEESNIIALTHILSPLYTVLAVKDGPDAIDVAEEFQPDVILLDIIMPEMNGYAVINALKGGDLTRDIPVIFITGLSNAGDEEKGLNLGAADYISKPFSPAIVKLRVKNQIDMINQTRLMIEKEAAAQSSRARSEFLSRVSHEMRTPMNAVMGMTALAKAAADADTRNEMLDVISAESRRLLELIDNVLDMSDIEDGKLRLEPAEFGFADMIRELLSRIGPEARAKRQALVADLDPSIPDTLIGDGRRLAQVILHLLSNAVKFTPEQGSIQISAHAREVEGEALAVEIGVADSGVGIAAEQQARLFLPFEQGDGGIDRKHGGAGLGLSISKHIVERMGGGIRVDSEPGKGSTFTFTVRLGLKAPEAHDGGPVSFEGKTALLADDVEINREIVVAMLEDAGMRIDCAENGLEALEMFISDPDLYDVVLMDINMPEMDGVEATKLIRALDAPQGAKVPIIAMTANVLMSEVETYLAAGMSGHIGKPVDFDKLMSLLAKYLAD